MPPVDRTPPSPPRSGRSTLIVVVGAFALLAAALAIAASRLGEPAPALDGEVPAATPATDRTIESPATAHAARGSRTIAGLGEGVGTVIEGVVRSRAGRPLAGAMVVLLELAPATPGLGLEYEPIDPARSARTPTDGAGRFRLPRRAPDAPAWISASAAGHASAMVRLAAATEEDVVLELAPGRLLRGRVTAPDGRGVGDGVVSVEQAWSATDFADSPGVALTEPDGSFAVGVAADAVRCDLRVDSTAHGRDFFLGVATEVFADLRWQARATLRGRVRAMSQEHVGKLAVRVRGELRDAPVPVFRTGLRRQLVGSGTVRTDGSYEVTDLQPGATYAAQLVQVALEGAEIGLTPSTGDPFVPTPGETVERDFEVSAPIVVRGRVTTATSHRPAAGLRVQVEFGGRVLWDASTETDTDGTFELRLTTGAGTYRLGAGPAPQVIERSFASGEAANVDLRVDEPVTLPVRVVDAGAGVESIATELWITDPDGRRSLRGGTHLLDAEGRTRFEIYEPVRSLRLSVMRFPRGPRRTTPTLVVTAGENLAEQTLTLPRAGGIGARFVDATGAPYAEVSVTVTARYADGQVDTFHARTDRAGRIDERGAVRREPATFEISVDDRPPWRSATLPPSAEGRFELGDVQA